MPKVVGEFDAALINDRIDEVVSANPDLNYVLLSKLCGQGQTLDELVNIKYKLFFRSGAYENYTTDGQISEVQKIHGLRDSDEVNMWHPDTVLHPRFQKLPEVITGTSKFPTQFLVGRLALSWHEFQEDRVIFELKYWQSEDGQLAIKNALEKGDAYTHSFQPGQVVKVHRGTLHKRDVPRDATGYRYFMRKFPAMNFLHAGTNLGRMRPY